ncbi:zinc ribbon domain-containing protein [Methylobacterium brachiatum]|uniref:zinc ribbon domain-containing protein n=1 Tax=Methylobacterium brachiatum TaxID=269660 RepID=UPI003522E2F8
MTSKTKLAGVSVLALEPAYTGQSCSCGGCLGLRRGKVIRYVACRHGADADQHAVR